MEAVKDPQRIVTHSQHQNKSLRADFGKWFFWAMFMAASGFVVVFDVLSSVQALENLFVIKILASSLGGVVGFMAAVRSGVFRWRAKLVIDRYKRVDLTQISVLSGLTATLIIAIVTIARQREFEPKHFVSYLAAYLSGSNIAPSVYLVLYVFFPDPDTVLTKLRGQEKHICFAGLALFVLSLFVLWKLLKDAYIRAAKSESSGHTSS